MKHFTPLENHYKITIDEKVYPGALYGNCCISSGINISNCCSSGINNQCLPYNPEMYEPSINNNSEYERLKYVGRVVKHKGKKWVAGLNMPDFASNKSLLYLTRITIFGNIKTALVYENDITLI